MAETRPHGRPVTLLFLGVTTVICGALVMVIEVLGSRVIGPFFGVSLFVWTSLIAVTLMALALGYAVGGSLSDRFDTPDALYVIVILAGLLTLIVPALREPVLVACAPLGLRTGALLSALLLFGPPLFVLGCVSPYVVRLAAREVSVLGRTVGRFYALSTMGSIAGTVLTGFVLISYLSLDHIFLASAATLIALGAVYFLGFRRRWWPLGLLVLPFLVPVTTTPASAVMADGTRATLVDTRESVYGTIKIIEYSFGELTTREMAIDGLVQGGLDTGNGLSVYEYPYFLTLLPMGLHPGARSCLVVGLGAGVVPAWYEARGISTDVVEIDPVVVSVAREYFGYAPAGTVHVADARQFLATSERRYDVVILDVFNGDITPVHVLSQEALRAVRQRLNPGGVLAINLVGSIRDRTFVTASVVRTAETVFESVFLYPTFDTRASDGTGNLILVAYDGPPRPLAPSVREGVRVHNLAVENVRLGLSSPLTFPPGTPATVFTDDFNPADVRDLWLREQVRRSILGTTNWQLLLGL